jgi:DNA-binding LacI/PurR family transcriptional regulator
MTEPKVQTITDLARLAGVSKATVSRALNDSPLIGDETKRRIGEIAREHRFQMNDQARRLNLKQSQIVALMTYAYTADSAVADAFSLEIMSGVSAGLHANGYDLLLIQIMPTDTEWVGRYLGSGRVDGFILMAASCTQQHISTLIEARAPFIIWGSASGTRDYCSVDGDNFAGGRTATTHMLRSGRRRIAFIGGPAREREVEERYRGYSAALHEAGIQAEDALVEHSDYSPASGAAAMRALLERAGDLDGVFVNSDLMAIAAIEQLQAQGRRVPEDVSVVGYDDVSLAAHSDPPLTTIRQNGPLAGRLLAENLIQNLRTGAVTSVTIPAELVVRKSA